MRTTRASSAVERLKRRSGNPQYAMVLAASGHFALVENKGGDAPERLCDWMELDDFVAFVNAYGPQTPKKVSKLDVAFEKQLTRKPSGKAP